MLSPQLVGMGLFAAFVGFASSFAVILQGLKAVGASPTQAASGLMALSVAMGLCGVALSLWKRMPISVAWSTPGAALLAATSPPAGGFGGAVGAFLIAGALFVVCGLFKPLGRAVAAIPTPLASAMLAGILLELCLAPVRAMAQVPAEALPIVLTWAVVAQLRRLYAVPAAVGVALVVIFAAGSGTASVGLSLWPQPVLVAPSFSLAGAVGIALPLFVVTMASQNIPGLAVQALNDYRPDPGPLFSATGLASLAAAPFGGHAVNLAAITAALCAGPEAHPDPARRYGAAVAAGAFYAAFGLLSGALTAFVGASQPILIETVAGLALLGALSAAMLNAVSEPGLREAAVVTFLVAASGVSFLGIGGAFWGLAAGGLLALPARFRKA